MSYKNVKAPFINGSLAHGSYWELAYTWLEWRDDASFTAVLYLDGMVRGGHAAYFVWRDDNNHTYPMFMSDIQDLLNRTVVEAGKTELINWIVIKRGKYYGIRMAE